MSSIFDIIPVRAPGAQVRSARAAPAEAVRSPGRGPDGREGPDRARRARGRGDRPHDLRAGLALVGARQADRRHRDLRGAPPRLRDLGPPPCRHGRRCRRSSWRTGDVFEVPPGHLAYVVGDEPWTSIDFAGRRLFAKSPEEASARSFATIVFTDLSRSTETAAPDGRRALARACWPTTTRPRGRQIERYQGREIKTTGDGFLVVFDSPGRAVAPPPRCSTPPPAIGLTARAGVHTGEIEVQGDDVRGIAVHAAARILAIAEPGQVLVSGTVQGPPRRVGDGVHRPRRA